MPETAKNWPINKAPKKTVLLGDKTIRLESAEYIIEFPGGAIEVARTSEGLYWAHIIVNNGQWGGPEYPAGTVLGSRITRDGEANPVQDIPGQDRIYQIAVLIGRQ